MHPSVSGIHICDVCLRHFVDYDKVLKLFVIYQHMCNGWLGNRVQCIELCADAFGGQSQFVGGFYQS